MPARIIILGVYPIEADEPCHLIEIVAEPVDAELDFETFTQEEG
jgi:hypothetical protein